MSTQLKLAAGAWRFVPTKDGAASMLIAGPRGVRLMRCEEQPGLGHDAEAIMARIAAAPTILEAAESLLARLENMTTEEFSRGEEKAEREAMRAAIALAHGKAPKASTTRAKKRA